jgi:predicted acetyltransferase
MTALVLRELRAPDEVAFLRGLEEPGGEQLTSYSFVWQQGISFPESLRRLADAQRGLGVPKGFVPSTILYGFVEDRIVGRLSIRHELTPALRVRGGHVGYAVLPPHRRQGHGHAMMAQAIPFCAALGLVDILATCSDDNTPSARILESVGGVLESTWWDEAEEELVRRYRIRVA